MIPEKLVLRILNSSNPNYQFPNSIWAYRFTNWMKAREFACLSEGVVGDGRCQGILWDQARKRTTQTIIASMNKRVCKWERKGANSTLRHLYNAAGTFEIDGDNDETLNCLSRLPAANHRNKAIKTITRFTMKAHCLAQITRPFCHSISARAPSIP